MKHTHAQGFTLLELIIVITIIGFITVLSLAFLGPSKDKGADAGVKSNLVNARSQAEFYYNGSGTSTESYMGVCNDSRNGIFRQVQTAMRSVNGTPRTGYTNTDSTDGTSEVCRSNTDDFVVWVPLADSTSASPRGWCVDGANASRRVTQVLGAGQYVCP